jgi:hypothetical protein
VSGTGSGPVPGGGSVVLVVLVVLLVVVLEVVVGGGSVVVVVGGIVDVVVLDVLVVVLVDVVVLDVLVVVLVDVVVLDVLVVVLDVAGAGASAVVTTSCGPFDCSRDLRSAPSVPLVFDSTKAKVPLPVTALVTSNSTHVPAGSFGSVPTSAARAGAVFHVRPFSVHPVPVVWSDTPWFVPLDPTRSRNFALCTGAVRALVVNLRYEFTAAFAACSTRSGSLS